MVSSLLGPVLGSLDAQWGPSGPRGAWEDVKSRGPPADGLDMWKAYEPEWPLRVGPSTEPLAGPGSAAWAESGLATFRDPGDRRRSLARELIGTPSEPFGVYLVAPSDPASELCRYVEARVFGEVFGDTSKVLEDEYGPYDSHSAFFLVVDHERLEPAGVMRIVLPSAAGFKSLNDIEPVWGEDGEKLTRGLVGFDESRTWDIATLAVAKEYRGGAAGGLVPLALYQALSTSTLRLGVEWWVAILDVVVLDLLGAMSVPFHGYEGLEARTFLGSPSSLPVWVSIAEADETVREKNPGLYPIAALGEPIPDLKGLDLDHLDALCPEPALAYAA